MSGPPACRVCGQALADDDSLALHLGRLHADELTDDERARFENALAAERAWVEVFTRHVKGFLYTLPLILSYFFILVLGAEAGVVSFTLAFLLFPGVGVFSGLAYYLAYAREKERQEERATGAFDGNGPAP